MIAIANITLEQWLEISKIFAAFITAVAALAGMTLGFLNRGKLHRVYLSLNSRLDQLLLAAHAEGRIAERKDIAMGAFDSISTPATRNAAQLLVDTAAATAAELVAATKTAN